MISTLRYLQIDLIFEKLRYRSLGGKLQVILKQIKQLSKKVQTLRQHRKIKCLGKEWGDPTGHPWLGLHGWLDNAGTFDQLAKEWPAGHRLVAIDTPGTLENLARYNYIQFGKNLLFEANTNELKLQLWPGVYFQPNSENLVRGKKSAPKKRGEKISQGNDDKKGIEGKREKMMKKNRKRGKQGEKEGFKYNGFQ